MKNKLDQTYKQALDSLVMQLEELDATPLLTADILKIFQREVESAFFLGWDAFAELSVAALTSTPTTPDPIVAKVSVMVDVGDEAWVHPLAIIEDMSTGDRFVDPRFPISDAPSDHHCVELMVTADGLVASGPADRHRLSPVVARDRLRPLVRYDVALLA